MSWTFRQLQGALKTPQALGLHPSKTTLLREACAAFAEAFGPSPDQRVYAHFVPGRVEVLGKHTDYGGGPTMVMALGRGFVVLSTENGTDQVNVANADSKYPAVSFPFTTEAPEMPGHWGTYAVTAARRIALNFGDLGTLKGADVAIASDLPADGGMSSSSALIIAMFFALAGPNQLAETERFRRNIRGKTDLAMYLAVVENGLSFRELSGSRGVGTFGGSEDHTAILCCKPEKLSVYYYCPTVFECDIDFPPDWVFAICHSGRHAVKTGEAMADYNAAAERAGAVREAYNGANGTTHETLREVVQGLQDEGGSVDSQRLRASLERVDPGRAEDLFLRFEQFVAEMAEIIPQTIETIRGRETDQLGRLIDRSHQLSKSHLYNIVAEVDCLQQLARERGAIAASGFGAGFGGSVYAIVEREGADEFLRQWRAAYEEQYPALAGKLASFVARPAGPAAEISG